MKIADWVTAQPWLIAAIVAGLFALALFSYPAGVETSAKYAQRCADENAARANQPGGSEQGYDKQPPSDWCDLAAQQRMAEATDEMKRATWATTALTFVGVFLLWKTLEATKDTLEEARNTTTAAIEAAEATLKVGTAQIRGYTEVEISGIDILPSSGEHGCVDPIAVHFLGVKNIGLTPCRNTNINLFADFTVDGKLKHSIEIVRENIHGVFDLPAQMDESKFIAFRKASSPVTPLFLAHEKCQIWIRCCVWFENAIGEEVSEDFHFFGKDKQAIHLVPERDKTGFDRYYSVGVRVSPMRVGRPRQEPS